MDDEARSELRASSMLHCVFGRSWKTTSAGVSMRSIGKSGGENERLMRSFSAKTGERGPQRWIVVSGSKSGAKNRSPSRWSRCRCVSRRLSSFTPRSTSSMPSSRIPVPSVEDEDGAVFQRDLDVLDVFPPQRIVCGPGVATEPRQPQILTRMTSPIPLPPEDSDDPDELVRFREEREGRTAIWRSTPSRLVTHSCSCAARRSSNAIRVGRFSSVSGEWFRVRGVKLAENSSILHFADLGERAPRRPPRRPR